MDERLKELEINYTGWAYNKWPTIGDFDKVFCYSKEKHRLLIGDPGASANRWKMRNGKHARTGETKYEKWVEKYGITDSGDSPDWMIPALKKFEVERKASAKQQKNRKDFVDQLTRGFKVNIEMTVRNYLNGATEGRSGIVIKGDNLGSYGVPMLERIGPDEYIMGNELSGLFIGQNDTTTSKVAYAILRSNAKFWPSSRRYRQDNEPVFVPILTWVLQRLKIVQIKMPTARKVSRPSYALLHQEAVDIYQQALKRWPDDITNEMKENIEIYIDAYGDLKKMKEFNSALQMEYTMTGSVD